MSGAGTSKPHPGRYAGISRNSAVPVDQWVPPGVRDQASGRLTSEQRQHRVLALRREGASIRQIAYLAGMPVSTVGDICKREHDSMPEPMPFYRLVDF